MGNEMGNNNTTGLKEKDNTAVEAPQEPSKEIAVANDVKEGNEIVPAAAAADKDFHEKANGLASNDPEKGGDLCADMQTSSKGGPLASTEKQENEATLSDNSPKVKVGSNEEDGGSIENKQASLSNGTEHDLIEPDMEKTVPESSENQLQKQISVEKEEDGTTNSDLDAISTSQDPQPEKPAQSGCDQQELATVHAEASVADGSGSSGDSDGDLGCISMENGNLSDTNALEIPEASIDTETVAVTEQKMGDTLVEENKLRDEKELCKDDLEAKDGDKPENGLSNVTTPSSILSCLGEKSDEGFSTEASSNGTDSSESEPETTLVTNSPNANQEAPEAEEKNMILKEESRPVGEEVENGEYKHDQNPTQSGEALVTEPETEDSNAFQSESIIVEQKEAANHCSDSESNKDCLTEEPKLAEKDEIVVSCISSQNGVFDEQRKDSEGDVVIVSELGLLPSESTEKDDMDVSCVSSQNGVFEEQRKDSEGDVVIVSELGLLPSESTEKDDMDVSRVSSHNGVFEEQRKDSEGDVVIVSELGLHPSESTEKDDMDVSCVSSQNGVFEEQRKDTEGDVVIVSELGLLPSESTEKDDMDVSRVSSHNGVFEQQRKDTEGDVVIVSELGLLPSESTEKDEMDVSRVSSQNGVFEEQRKDSEGDVVIFSELGLLPSESSEKDEMDVSCVSSQNGVFEQQRKDTEGDVVIFSELRLLPSESSEKDDMDVKCISSQNGVFEEQRKDSEGHVVIVAELGLLPSESNIADCNHKGEESSEWKIVEDQKEENLEPLYAMEIETGGTQIAVDQAEAVMPPQHLQQESALGSETVQSNNFGEFLPAKASTFDSTNSIAKIVVSMNELAVTQLIERPKATAKEADISSNRSYAFPRCNGSEARESAGRLSIASMERLSTDSDPDNLNLHAHMRKSPSFNLNLQNEESDQTPLLYEDKAEIQSSPRQSDVSLGNTTIQNGYKQDLLQQQAMPVEEKVVTLERSDSEKSKTPFLGLLKEEEESPIVGARKEAKDLWKSPSRESTSSSPKGKEKRRVRSSLFGNCLCCATVIN
ncbi:hypothetical protein UlMin_009781 [Ulmus minor]